MYVMLHYENGEKVRQKCNEISQMKHKIKHFIFFDYHIFENLGHTNVNSLITTCEKLAQFIHTWSEDIRISNETTDDSWCDYCRF